jgi:hypothetical protein
MSTIVQNLPHGRMEHANQGASPLPVRSRTLPEYWRGIQYALLAAGVLLVGLLLFAPRIGLLLLWNVLIPVAPLLVVVAPGLWRNICPMATLSLLPRRLGFLPTRPMPARAGAILCGVAILALLLIVPFRHLSLNTDGPLSALMLLASSAVALLGGRLFEGKSGWCTTLCPISPVERLYGFSPAFSFRNVRCESCRNCTVPCPDSVPGLSAKSVGAEPLAKKLDLFLTGGFAGFVWGWFQVPDYPGSVGVAEILTAYAWPFGCAALSLFVFFAGRQWLFCTNSSRRLLAQGFAFLAVGSYYWFRVPALFGFGDFWDTGVLYDASETLPAWFPMAAHVATTSFLAWFMLLRSVSNKSWTVRPVFERKKQS